MHNCTRGTTYSRTGSRWTRPRHACTWGCATLGRCSPSDVVGRTGGAAQINVNDLGGGVQRCCPGHYFFHCERPGVVRRLLHLVMGDWEGLILRQGVGSSITPGLQGRQLRKRLRHIEITKGDENCREAKRCNAGQIRRKFVRISQTLNVCESCVNIV